MNNEQNEPYVYLEVDDNNHDNNNDDIFDDKDDDYDAFKYNINAQIVKSIVYGIFFIIL